MYKLMIVDDEPLTREFIKHNLSQLHAEWMCAGEASDGQEALELLGKGETFDLIVTDIRMPVMSGLELAQQLAGRRGSPRIVILSGYDEFSMAKEAMQYGVHDYLLKPLVKEELIRVLNKMAEQLTTERSYEATYQTLLALSEQSRKQIARNFLRAVISDNNIEIKVLYPILHRLKISLLEAEGAIMIVDLDESGLLERNISPSDHALFRYIVHQTAAELSASSSDIMLFTDNEERTVILVPGDHAIDVSNRCKRLFSELSSTVLDMTGLHICGAVGTSEIEVLQLNVSYHQAYQTLKYQLFFDSPPFDIGTVSTELQEKVKKLDKVLDAVHAAVNDRNDIQLHSTLAMLVNGFEPLDWQKLLRLGSYILNRLRGSSLLENKKEAVLASMHFLKEQSKSELYSPEEVVSVYRRMLEALNTPAGNPSREDARNEHEIVTKVKEYIHGHFAEPLSLAHIAEKMGVSSGYLSSLFHSNSGESYIKFLTRVRMEHASSLLRKKPADKIYDIAEKVGYTSVKHFSYVFKQYYSIPPGEYQERHLR